jgi:Fe-S oxidoreductase
MKIPIWADEVAAGRKPEVLFWVGCSGSFDARAQSMSRSFAKILNEVGVSYAILGEEENCTGDPARRAGNEFVFQMLAVQNIEVLKAYEITDIVCTCPHCFNTLMTEYPDLGGHFRVKHYSTFLNELITSGKLKVAATNSETVTYHDSCYLGRINGEYEAPREVIESLNIEIKEMNRIKSNGLCCGAGGAQMFKEDEKGNKRINTERAEEVLSTDEKVVIANCPFCITMLEDGLKEKEKQDDVMVLDLAELIVQKNKW